MPKRVAWQLVVLVLVAILPARASAQAHAPASPTEEVTGELSQHVPGAEALDGRIRAPCCWNQTIDIHGSEVSVQLRREIRKRLLAGESPEAIEASFVARYGERILAVPRGSPIKAMGTGLIVLMAGAGVGGFFMLKRWRRRESDRRAATAKDTAGSGPADERLEARLDAELRALDD